ncbi:hypothetical protein TPHA_0M01920 [Tetrapisispora phaffii CBS 4417]|uniref:PPM-type phosphatase domain-containing protein n=1 Tax=Tetrapisispora phaffii (strain ATCC 24235 / CBS 4417 / NBRC 1672 / NRRL Y-8282 / UCD 70-5) TaxID=1071381 RepID=G8C0Q2_TETPH|nr:hypothetical protein TPHA_0M01920 [Tetrapisispora phaffii CBS 4417]CCE65767.1 hypothetical protein TPHA_0M01920 [Tetrapisispora phaffii CBS 4417]
MVASQSFIRIKPVNLVKLSAQRNGRAATHMSSVSETVESAKNDQHMLRIPLKRFPSVIGHSTSRISRRFNEDTYSMSLLKLPSITQELLISQKLKNGEVLDDVELRSRSILNLSVFDGHGGDRVSKLLAEKLHDEVSNDFITKEDFYELLRRYKDLIKGRYWENLYRTRDTFYEKFIKNCNTKEEQVLFGLDNQGSRMIFDKWGNIIDKISLLTEQERLRIFYAYLKFDLESCCGYGKTGDSSTMSLQDRVETFKGGSTASSIFISAYGNEHNLFDESFFVDPRSLLKLVVTQVGDSKILLCDSNGIAHSLTKIHSASSKRESKRLLYQDDMEVNNDTSLNSEADIIEEDAFGDKRFLNNFANTRSFGDLIGKPEGLSSEPDIYSYLIGSTKTIPHSEKSKLQFGGDECFITLISDGVSNILSDQEVVDLITSTVNLRGLKKATPQYVADEVIKFISALSNRNSDNATCVVLRLPNWGNWPNIDRSGAERELKLLNVP